MQFLVDGVERYRLGRELGAGGFGAVFEATPAAGGPLLALKLLHLDALLRDDARSRFRREARVAQALVHPNVVRILDWGETDQGIPFIAWELLQGRTLEALLREGPLELASIARLARQVLAALGEAHSREIVHRDIKPSNIFVCGGGRDCRQVKVLDFGIAAARAEFASQSLTAEGMTIGTPAYMPPEQVLGEALDGRADLYALGLVLAECLSGVPVYGGATGVRIALAQSSGDPVPLSPVVRQSSLGAVIERATRKNRLERWSSAVEMRAEVDRAVPSSRRRHITLGIGLGGLVLVVAAVALWVVAAWTRHEPPRKTMKAPTPAYFARCRYHDQSPTDLGARLVERGYLRTTSSEDSDLETELHVKGNVAVTLVYQRAGAFAAPGPGNEDTPRSSRLVLSAPPCSLTVLVAGPSIAAGEAARLMSELAPEPARP